MSERVWQSCPKIIDSNLRLVVLHTFLEVEDNLPRLSSLIIRFHGFQSRTCSGKVPSAQNHPLADISTSPLTLAQTKASAKVAPENWLRPLLTISCITPKQLVLNQTLQACLHWEKIATVSKQVRGLLTPSDIAISSQVSLKLITSNYVILACVATYNFLWIFFLHTNTYNTVHSAEVHYILTCLRKIGSWHFSRLLRFCGSQPKWPIAELTMHRLALIQAWPQSSGWLMGRHLQLGMILQGEGSADCKYYQVFMK